VYLLCRDGSARDLQNPVTMRRSPRSLTTIAAITLAACAPKAATSHEPAADAQSDGGPHHHCVGVAPPPPTPYELAIAIPYDPAMEPRISPDERAAFEAARPAFVRYCVRCHASGTKKVKRSTLDRLDMTRYPFTSRSDDVAATVRAVVGAGGGTPSMPLVGRGCLADSELAAIAAWADVAVTRR
jgi:cytochrome c553